MKQLWIEADEERYIEKRAQWIQEQLADQQADKSHSDWEKLCAEYELLFADLGDIEAEWDVFGKSRIQLFDEGIRAFLDILTVSINPASSKNLFVMLHAQVVTSVEAYLSSTFISKSLSTDALIRRLVETDPEFAQRKFTIKDIFSKHETLKKDISKYLKDLIFHDIAKVKAMYATVLGVDFGEVSWLYEAVSLRHHCVHRAGYDKDGNEISLTKESIRELISQCVRLVHTTEEKVRLMPDDGGSW